LKRLGAEQHSITELLDGEKDNTVKTFYFIGVAVVLLTVANFFGVGQWP